MKQKFVIRKTRRLSGNFCVLLSLSVSWWWQLFLLSLLSWLLPVRTDRQAEPEQVNIVRVRFAGANANIDLRELPPPQAAGPVAGSRQLSRQQAVPLPLFHSRRRRSPFTHTHSSCYVVYVDEWSVKARYLLRLRLYYSCDVLLLLRSGKTVSWFCGLLVEAWSWGEDALVFPRGVLLYFDVGVVVWSAVSVCVCWMYIFW